ncbi:MAG TPA: sugar phosphate isomerase/epimerase family protein [Verrucomicrobiales bacterium]|nr:sugar phosphate isomerase/epimerase family protein [Verrucomicrobiales bacterium]
MKTRAGRRGFLAASAAAAWGGLAARLGAAEPFARPGRPSFRLSLAAYSFRDSFRDPDKLDMFRFVDYCAEQGIPGAELTSYYFPEDADEAYFLKLRRYAYLRGIGISGTAVGNNFALPEGEERDREIAGVKGWIDRAAVLGAPHIRVFAGRAQGAGEAEARNLCVNALEECCDYAGKKGIFLGLENHGGIVAEADGLLEIVQAVRSPWFGVSLDTGNFHTTDPYGDLARCAPYAVNVQVKVEMRARGGEREAADMDRIAGILRAAAYQGYVALEYEAEEDPWVAVPRHLKELAAALG